MVCVDADLAKPLRSPTTLKNLTEKPAKKDHHHPLANLTTAHHCQALKTTMKRTSGTKIPVQALIKEPKPTPCDKDHKASMPSE